MRENRPRRGSANTEKELFHACNLRLSRRDKSILLDGRMSKIEFETKLETLTAEISRVNQEMKTLTQRRSDALQRTDQTAAQTIQEAKEIRDELSELQEKLEDLTVLKTAVQGKVAVYKNNAPKAAAIRNEISSEVWPKAVKCYRKIRPLLDELGKVIAELNQFNKTMYGLSAQHEKLAGERMNTPAPFIYFDLPMPFAIPFGGATLTALVAIGKQLPEIPETIKLTLQSEATRPEKKQSSTAKESKKTQPDKTELQDSTVYVNAQRHDINPKLAASKISPVSLVSSSTQPPSLILLIQES